LTQCPNCQSPLEQNVNFCPHCGQKNHDLRVPFWHLFLEVFEGIFHLDGKSYLTARALVLKPGFLTNEFRIGRRAGYVPPIRLYLFISFVFFLVLSFASGSRHSEGKSEKQNALNFSFYSVSSKDLQGLNEAQVDSLMVARGIERTAFKKYLALQLGRVSASGRAEVNHMLIKGVSYMMFVLMPFFGLLLFLFYRKTKEYYLNCLVFSVHFHCFAFILFTIIALVGMLIDSTYLIMASPFILAAYLWIALRAIYRQKRFVTALKIVVIGFMHLFGIVVAFLLAIWISILLF
jgi:hypothetical protein